MGQQKSLYSIDESWWKVFVLWLQSTYKNSRVPKWRNWTFSGISQGCNNSKLRCSLPITCSIFISGVLTLMKGLFEFTFRFSPVRQSLYEYDRVKEKYHSGENILPCSRIQKKFQIKK